MKKKIFLYNIIIIVMGLCITGVFTSTLAQFFYKVEVENTLKQIAALIEFNISEQLTSGKTIDYNKIAKDYSRALNKLPPYNNSKNTYSTRLTFIDFNGTVLGESEIDYLEMENHLDRKEVQKALKGHMGTDERFSKSVGLKFLYVAVPFNEQKIIIRVSVPLIQLQMIEKSIWLFTFIVVLVGILLTLALALKFIDKITKPINKLILASNEISKGNYSKRVDITTNDELGQLASSFNGMAVKLEETVSEMMDKNIKVDSIINSMQSGIVAVDSKFKVILINSNACELFGIKHGPGIIGLNMLELIRNHQINSFLKESIVNNAPISSEIAIGSPHERVLRLYANPIKSKDNLTVNSGGIATIQDITNIKRLELIRTEFVSNVTHELKTPLTSIRGFIETLRSGAMNDKDVADKFLEIIDIEAERLYILINDILQLSEIETKPKDSNISSHNLKAIIDETLSILGGVAEKKNIKISANVSEEIQIVANKDRIKQMLINLIENGIKYNIDGGSVKIRADKLDGKIGIWIKDTGIGIPKEHIPRIFERFYRVDKGRSRNLGGTGLGLSIVKHIVNLYNGDIRVTSEFGDGTEFFIQLPL